MKDMGIVNNGLKRCIALVKKLQKKTLNGKIPENYTYCLFIKVKDASLNDVLICMSRVFQFSHMVVKTPMKIVRLKWQEISLSS